MDAILLREAGGLGDILQIGSTVPLLLREGYQVHLYTMMDPAIVALAGLIPGISRVHSLRMTTNMRRPRGATQYRSYAYLTSALAHAHGIRVVTCRNKLFDMYCPAWESECRDLRVGQLPQMSRAQAFVRAVGYPPEKTKPARLRMPSGPLAGVPTGYVVVSPWSRDPARSVGDGFVHGFIESIAQLAPVVVLDYGTGVSHRREMQDVLWYPQDFGDPNHTQAVHDTVRLIAYSTAVVTVDTFALHVAGSFGKPIVLLDGPTVATSVASHYSNVVTCRSDTNTNTCKGCYYMAERGFTRSCRTKGCRVIDCAASGDVVASLEQATSCVSS